MSGIGLAYKLPEQQTASTLDAGARAVSQPPAPVTIGLAKVPVSPQADPRDIDPNVEPVPDTPPAAAAPVAPAPAPIAPAKTGEDGLPPLIDFDKNPIGSIGLLLSAAGAGLDGKESPVIALRKEQLERQAMQYKTSSLALDVVGKYETILSKSQPGDHKGIIDHAQAMFGPALGGLDIKPILTAFSDGSIKNAQAKLQAAQQFLSPQALAVYANDPTGLDKLLTTVLEKKATQESPEEAAAKAKAIALAQGEAGAVKPQTPAELAANKIAQQNANNSGASLTETRRHNQVDEAAAANKPLTPDQSNSALFADRAHQAESVLKELGSVQGTSRFNRAADQLPNGYAPVSNDFKRLRQAETNFLTAVLRKESGASISPSEFDSGKAIYFSQPGDPPDLIKQKEATREAAIAGIARGAGPNYSLPDPLGIRGKK